MSVSDIFKVVAGGGPDAIFLLLIFSSLILAGRLYAKNAIDYRDEQIDYRDKIIDRQNLVIDEQRKLFDTTISTMRNDIIPLIEGRQSGARRVNS